VTAPQPEPSVRDVVSTSVCASLAWDEVEGSAGMALRKDCYEVADETLAALREAGWVMVPRETLRALRNFTEHNADHTKWAVREADELLAEPS
jgi:hypothetical protein